MKFVVEWKKTATDELANIWLAADSMDRRRISTAAREADRVLQYDPEMVGESRDRDYRITFVTPLAVTFRVDVQANRVDVLRVRQFH